MQLASLLSLDRIFVNITPIDALDYSCRAVLEGSLVLGRKLSDNLPVGLNLSASRLKGNTVHRPGIPSWIATHSAFHDYLRDIDQLAPLDSRLEGMNSQGTLRIAKQDMTDAAEHVRKNGNETDAHSNKEKIYWSLTEAMESLKGC